MVQARVRQKVWRVIRKVTMRRRGLGVEGSMERKRKRRRKGAKVLRKRRNPERWNAKVFVKMKEA